MKRENTSKPLLDSEALARALEAAPDEPVEDIENPPTAPEDWGGATATHGGGVEATITQLRSRGLQKAPRKEATTIRLSPEVLGYFRGTGRGWQTRIDEVLRAYVEQHRG